MNRNPILSPLLGLAGGGHGSTPTIIYRTNADVVSAGANVTAGWSHPSLKLYNMPTRRDVNLQFPDWHDLNNFYDKKHTKYVPPPVSTEDRINQIGTGIITGGINYGVGQVEGLLKPNLTDLFF